MKESEENYGIYNLNLFEYVETDEDFNFDALRVTRVPGGWLFENVTKIYSDTIEDEIIRYASEATFVPYNEEFK